MDTMAKATKKNGAKGANKGQQTIYKMITERLISRVEDSINSGKPLPWARPWRNGRPSGGAISYATKAPYDFVNQMLLGCAGTWVSWTEIQRQGARLRKGAQGCFIVERFRKEDKREIENENGETEEKTRYFWKLKYFTVYNVDDVEGLRPLNFTADEPSHADPMAEGEAVISEYEAREHIKIFREAQNNEAYYSPARDEIHVPSIKQYKKSKRAEYYSTLFHEMTHSTGHFTRLDRFKSEANAAFGSEAYSQEELVAEMGAAIMCATVGIATDASLNNSAAYLRSWLKALKDDITLAYWAARQAEKAVNYMLYGKEGYKPEEDAENESAAPVDKTEAADESEDRGEAATPAPSADSVPQGEAESKPFTPFKSPFYILASDGKGGQKLLELNGYVFTVGKYRFGVTNKAYDEAGNVYTASTWAITDLGSGRAVDGGFKTRKAAMDKAYEWAKDERFVKFRTEYEAKCKDVNPDINPKTAIYGLG